MQRYDSVEQFREYQRRLNAEAQVGLPTIVIPAGTCGRASGAEDLIRETETLLASDELNGRVQLLVTGCHGFCEAEPSVLVEPQGFFYPKVSSSAMGAIVRAAVKGEAVESLLFRESDRTAAIAFQRDLPFFKNQARHVLGRNEKVDPLRIETYVAAGGYAPLCRVLEKGDSSWVVEQIKMSGLRGRGGAGFPTGLKWEMLAAQRNGSGKFLVCNADEGDPGAYMDRSVLEGNPHAIIEGMLIGAFGTGANQGIIYVRNEYPLAIENLTVALQQARQLGVLGDSVLGTGFAFDISIVKGAGAFVCGEETALIHSIEGKTGEPRQRPPYPVERGINGKPTVINNVETLANISVIIERGAEAFAQTGTKGNSGTKIFSLVGKIRNTGLVEIPMGMSIKDIVYNIGGGAVGKARIKAVQTGGPSGGCIPAEMFDLAVDYDSLAKAGSIVGSGGMIVMDENTCMVDVAKYFMNFLKDESCGKCYTCRKGTQRMYELLDDISCGRATLAHLDLLEQLCHVVKDTTMCGLGQTAANPVLSTLRYFRNEYERHVVDKRCDSFVCREITGAPCQSACPLDTEAWRYVALIEKRKYNEAYQVIREANPLPSICGRVCDRKCEQRCNLGTTGGEPIAIRTLKRFVTDRVDPSVFQAPKQRTATKEGVRVAVVGGGPAGLSAAHYLSLAGYSVTIFESKDRLGGMLESAIPAYRLPREVLRKEIDHLIDDNITVEFGRTLGKNLTLDDLSTSGFATTFLAMGAHASSRLGLPGEDLEGIYPSLDFLKAFNVDGKELAKGHVGVVGGGNSAVDAARVALRQSQVKSVTLLYRRGWSEMPAFEEELEAAAEEGIAFQTLVSPMRIRYIGAALEEGVRLEPMLSPVRIQSEARHLVGIECVRNELGDVDWSGRRKPVPIAGSEFSLSLDTLIVAVGERPETQCLQSMGIDLDKGGRIHTDRMTLQTSRSGVFAGGDVVSGPYTVVDALASGRKAARMIDLYLRGQPLLIPSDANLPRHYVEPPIFRGEEDAEVARVVPSSSPVESRIGCFAEVEQTLSEQQAICESRRCLRCDLAFTECLNTKENPLSVNEEK